MQNYRPGYLPRYPANRKKSGGCSWNPKLRDWLWLEVATWLRDEAPVFGWTTPEERQHAEDLAGELASVTYDLDSSGCIVVEDKDSMRKRLGHSPDLGDSLCCTFASARPWAGQVVIL